MNEPGLDLEDLRADWQQGSSPPPELSVDSLRRRLRWRWLGVAVDILCLILVGALMIWTALNNSSASQWIYWSFFAVAYVTAGGLGLRLRLASLWRRGDTAADILEHARRDARLRQRSGQLGIWVSLIILLFFAGWWLANGLMHEQSFQHFLRSSWTTLAFVSLWCVGFAAAHAWMQEKGRRQLLELSLLSSELEST